MFIVLSKDVKTFEIFYLGEADKLYRSIAGGESNFVSFEGPFHILKKLYFFKKYCVNHSYFQAFLLLLTPSKKKKKVV